MTLPGQKPDGLGEGFFTVNIDPRVTVGEVGATLSHKGHATLHQKANPLVADTGPHQHKAVDLSLLPEPVVGVDLRCRVLHRVQQQVEAMPVQCRRQRASELTLIGRLQSF